jgi:CheY-like chemotaxis protein
MTLCGRDVLLLGQNFQTANGLADRLHRWGFRCHFASSMRTACQLLSSVRVDMVLSNMSLPDGTGLDLLAALSGLPITVFLCQPVENSCFWLPGIDGGKECFGLPALRPSEFANALEEVARSLGSAPQVNQPIPKAEVS